MAALLLWDTPTMLVVVGGGYWLVHLHHQRKTSKAPRTSRGFFTSEIGVSYPTAFAAARPALRPENRQPPRNVPSSER
jgi:hypothetical protein